MIKKILQVIFGMIAGIYIGISSFTFDAPIFVGVIIVFIILFVAVFIHIIIHELGHLIFGLLSGYHFVSFRILSFQLTKTKDGYKFHRYSLAGTGGQCLLEPPNEVGEKYPYKLYLIGGIIFNFFFALVAMLINIYVDSNEISLFLSIFFFVGLFLGLSNLIPIKEPIQNDGYNFFKMSEEDERYLWVQFKIYALQIRGVKLSDMNEEFFKYVEPVGSSFEASVGLAAINRAESIKDFDEVERIATDILDANNNVMLLIKNLTKVSLLYKRIICEEDIELLYEETESIRKRMSLNPSIIRCEYAYHLLISDNDEVAKAKRQLFFKIFRSYPDKTTILYEKDLIILAEQKKTIKNH